MKYGRDRFSENGRFAIWYMRDDYFRDGTAGYDFLKKYGLLPNMNDVGATHTYLGKLEAKDKDDVFYQMQGETWSPNGEARELIRSLKLTHTSMSVGDIIRDRETDEWFMVDSFGFKKL